MAIAKWDDVKKLNAFNEIILWMCEGKSVNSILKGKKESMPSPPTFYLWLQEDDELLNKYARALKIRADVLVDEMIDIADDSSNDTKIAYNNNGEEIEIEDKEWTNRTKIRLDTRKWIASRMNPKKYGDKIDMEVEVTNKTIKFDFGNKEIEDATIIDDESTEV